MMKTNKSYAKRLKVTKNGIVKARKGGINHFNAKKSRKKQLAQKRDLVFPISNKARSRFLVNI
jgi:ribosomal protein L35